MTAMKNPTNAASVCGNLIRMAAEEDRKGTAARREAREMRERADLLDADATVHESTAHAMLTGGKWYWDQATPEEKKTLFAMHTVPPEWQ